MSQYYIEFNTNKLGIMTATRIEIKTEVITDMNKQMAVNLIDDPLYKKLVEYVLNNLKPSGGCMGDD